MEKRIACRSGIFFTPPKLLPRLNLHDGVSDGQDFLFWGSFDCFELILNIILMFPPLYLAPPPLKAQKIT